MKIIVSNKLSQSEIKRDELINKIKEQSKKLDFFRFFAGELAKVLNI